MSNEVFQQNLDDEKGSRPGGPYLIQMLFKEPVSMPGKAEMTAVMEKHIGTAECFCHDKKTAGFAALEHMAEFKDVKAPVQLMVMGCSKFKGKGFDAFLMSQMWNCGKLLLAEDVCSQQIEGADRFIRFGVNVRFFNIQGTEDMLIDTVGMSTLFLPDLQYHFHGMDPNWVVNHAYNAASYILANDNPIKDGETIDGIADGQMSRELQWKCRYEDALIQPPRGVVDIHMGEYASGKR